MNTQTPARAADHHFLGFVPDFFAKVEAAPLPEDFDFASVVWDYFSGPITAD